MGFAELAPKSLNPSARSASILLRSVISFSTKLTASISSLLHQSGSGSHLVLHRLLLRLSARSAATRLALLRHLRLARTSLPTSSSWSFRSSSSSSTTLTFHDRVHSPTVCPTRPHLQHFLWVNPILWACVFFQRDLDSEVRLLPVLAIKVFHPPEDLLRQVPGASSALTVVTKSTAILVGCDRNSHDGAHHLLQLSKCLVRRKPRSD